MSRIVIRNLGMREYVPVWQAMQRFTQLRTEDTVDELWLVEHAPVYTLGRNGKAEHILESGDIPVVQVDRGGQVTYHGPGQVVIYPLVDIGRMGIGVRELVTRLEQAVIQFLEEQGIKASARRDAPGVYVGGRKIAALGLRIRQGRSTHGLSFNVDMDLSAFTRINPCGYEDLEVTQLRDLGGSSDWQITADGLCRQLVAQLGYTRYIQATADQHVINNA